jgi:hypothetical protein
MKDWKTKPACRGAIDDLRVGCLELGDVRGGGLDNDVRWCEDRPWIVVVRARAVSDKR